MNGMNTIRMREEVERALQSEWAGFQQRHPRLAAVLDHELLLEQAMEALDQDEEYRQAIAEATVEHLAGDVLSGIVLRCVQQWLRMLA